MILSSEWHCFPSAMFRSSLGNATLNDFFDSVGSLDSWCPNSVHVRYNLCKHCLLGKLLFLKELPQSLINDLRDL